MYRRSAYLALSVAVACGAIFLSTNSAYSQGGVRNAVWLQSATPGTSQSGHSNISGTARAGSFVGDGAAITGINAANISSGILADARLSSNVARRNAVNAFALSNSFAGFVGVGTAAPLATSPAQVEIRNTGASSAVNLQLHTTSTTAACWLRFVAGGIRMADISHDYATDMLTILNDNTSINIDDSGFVGVNTSTAQGASDLVIQSTNASSYGGISVRSLDGTTGRPFFGYATPTRFSWTYLDEQTDEWRLFHGSDQVRVSLNGTIGIKEVPPALSSADLEMVTDVNDGMTKDGIRSSVNGTGSPYGVWGRTFNMTGTGTGVRGFEQSNSAMAYGVFAEGNMGAIGTKSFQIDHPLDPANKYLKHYCTEAPSPQNSYSGTIRTNPSGFAWVVLPDYFGEININFRYQLTVIDDSDDFVMAKVTREIENNRFQFRTSKPNVKVSWEVKADRNDRYVQNEGAPSEIDKPEYFRGTYQNPEHWGFDKSKGEEFRREQIAASEAAARERNRKPVDNSKLQAAKKKGNVGDN